MSTMHFYAWKKGLKTGMYYLRTRPAADAIAFTVDQQALLCNHIIIYIIIYYYILLLFLLLLLLLLFIIINNYLETEN